MTRTLISQQVHLKDDATARLFAVSQALLRRLNPGVDRMVMDNASPVDPRKYVDDCNYYRFSDSLGHFGPSFAAERPDPKDGPGRATVYSLQIAEALGYDQWFYCEADCLFGLPIDWGFSQLVKRIGAQPGVPKYNYKYDWHVWWLADLPWFVNDLKFPEKYDWPNSNPNISGEHVFERIMGDEVQELPVKGIRGETVGLNPDNFDQHHPDGCHLTTHVSSETHAKFLRDIGHGDLVDLL